MSRSYALAVALLASACSKASKPVTWQSPVGSVCIGPSRAPFDPLAAMAPSPVPHTPTAWWTDATLFVSAIGCHSSSERLTGVPVVSRAGKSVWTVDGHFTAETPSGMPLLADCGAGHFAYHLGPLDPGHHEIHVAASTFAFDVPAAPAASDGSCFNVPAGPVAGPSVPPGAVVQPFTPSATASAPVAPVATIVAAPPDADTPAPSDWCTFRNGYVCPVGFDCCVAGPVGPGRSAPCDIPRAGLGRLSRGGNVCK